jgi:uncharacterized membrane protein
MPAHVRQVECRSEPHPPLHRPGLLRFRRQTRDLGQASTRLRHSQGARSAKRGIQPAQSLTMCNNGKAEQPHKRFHRARYICKFGYSPLEQGSSYMNKKSRREITLYRLFRLGIWGKGVDGLLEILGGILLLLVTPAALNQWVIGLTQHELVEDPHDLIATFARRSTAQLSANTQLFASLYLLVHGLVKVGLMVGLLRGKRWAFPAALGFLGLFILYQCYQLSYHYSLGLLVLTIFDATIVALTWHEYRLYRYE